VRCAPTVSAADGLLRHSLPDSPAGLPFDIMTLSYNTVTVDTGQLFTLAGLADASAAVLDALGIEARNGQVRDRPDIRTIRYYGTLGLVDRPAEMSGRTALYSGRHLLQVLAVKALQARGASLADVQRTLVGASDAELRSAVGPGLPAALAAAADVPAAEAGATTQHPRDSAFWLAPPAAPRPEPARAGAVPATTGPATTAPATTAPATTGSTTTGPITTGPAMQPRPVTAIPLAPGVTVLIDSGNAATVDVAAMQAAADPLLTYLTGAGLLPAPPTCPGADT
jgi:DNA-binding transcriptional MerR regulator